MEAKELRLNNWVNNPYDEAVEVDFQILHYIAICNLNKQIVENYNPIPLSEEWLLKAGFVSIGDSHQIMYSKKAITLYKQDGIFWCDILWDSLEVKYVHQLQNLFYALSGEELTFND